QGKETAAAELERVSVLAGVSRASGRRIGEVDRADIDGPASVQVEAADRVVCRACKREQVGLGRAYGRAKIRREVPIAGVEAEPQSLVRIKIQSAARIERSASTGSRVE